MADNTWRTCYIRAGVLLYWLRDPQATCSNLNVMNSFDTFLLCHRSTRGKYTLSSHVFLNVLQCNYFLIISLLQIVFYATSESLGHQASQSQTKQFN